MISASGIFFQRSAKEGVVHESFLTYDKVAPFFVIGKEIRHSHIYSPLLTESQSVVRMLFREKGFSSRVITFQVAIMSVVNTGCTAPSIHRLLVRKNSRWCDKCYAAAFSLNPACLHGFGSTTAGMGAAAKAIVEFPMPARLRDRTTNDGRNYAIMALFDLS